MLLALCLVVSVVGVLANPTAVVLRSKNDNNGLGNYEFWFEQSDFIHRWQNGELKYTSDGKPFVYTTGGYAYYDPLKDVLRIVKFVADENGYRPTFSEEEAPPGAGPPRFNQGAAGGG